MARRRKPSLFGQAAALIQIGEGLRGIRTQNQLEKLKAQKLQYDTRKAYYAAQHEQIKARRTLIEAKHREATLRQELIRQDLELERLAADIAQKKAQTDFQVLRNKLDSYKLEKMDPNYAPGGSEAYECPICNTYYATGSIVNKDYMYCTNPGCNNAKLVPCVLNLN